VPAQHLAAIPDRRSRPLSTIVPRRVWGLCKTADSFEHSPFESLPRQTQSEFTGALARTVLANGERGFRHGEPNGSGLVGCGSVTIFNQVEPSGDFGPHLSIV